MRMRAMHLATTKGERQFRTIDEAQKLSWRCGTRIHGQWRIAMVQLNTWISRRIKFVVVEWKSGLFRRNAALHSLWHVGLRLGSG